MSRELDARVAEKVIKLPNVIPDKGIYMPYSDESEIIPNYSTDIGLAMELLDQFKSFSICTNKHIATVVVVCDKGYYHEVNHESIPIAICVAALEAVGDREWVKENFYDKSLESEAMLSQGIEDAKAGRISPLDEDLLADDE